MEKLTYWQKAVWLTFNPIWDAKVQEIKELYAKIIDELDDIRTYNNQNSDIVRLCSVAITEAQTAQMRAVKAITSDL